MAAGQTLLEGLRVVELERILAGPWIGQTLADLEFGNTLIDRADVVIENFYIHSEPMVAAGASIEFILPARAGEWLTATASETFRTERYGIYDVAVPNESRAMVEQFRGRCARFRGIHKSA
jgi:acyl-CoA thioesterase